MSKDTFNVLVQPMLTERSMLLKDKQNRYSFKVDISATKIEIRNAVEKLFKVKVKKVCTSIMPGKLHRVGKFEGLRKDWKKAIVTLQKGQKIDVTEAS